MALSAHQGVHKSHDPNVSFEEYLYYARESRIWEDSPANAPIVGLKGPGAVFNKIFGRNDEHSKIIVGRGTREHTFSTTENNDKTEKNPESTALGGLVNTSSVSDEEWTRAARAGKTATWGVVFFLLTTDILGPFSVPWAISQTGYGPGFALYTVFGALAGFAGWQLWYMFVHLDSIQYPLKTYGDVAYRVYGSWARHFINVLQSLVLICIVSGVILSSGQSIAQISKNKICYVICIFIYAVAGMILGQIRPLRNVGWLANLAVWINLMIMFLVMGVSAHSPPNYAAALASYSIPEGPVVHSAGTPSGTSFINSLNGLNQAVYSYGGSMMFCEFMSEMRRPADFWKGMVCAQAFIYSLYMIFGMVVPQSYNWQTAVNIMFLFSGLIAACLYGNIGVKVFYITIMEELFHAPPITSKAGKWLWVGLVPIYWAIAFIIATAVPQFSYISGLVGALCILQMTYTFPPILMLGFKIKQGSMLAGEGFTRQDGGLKRWGRGFKAHLGMNCWNIFFALGAAVTAVLGIYSSIISLIEGFEGKTVATSFGCTAPV